MTLATGNVARREAARQGVAGAGPSIALVMAVLYQQLVLSRDTRSDVVPVRRTRKKVAR